jgi:hypothetical protein
MTTLRYGEGFGGVRLRVELIARWLHTPLRATAKSFKPLDDVMRFSVPASPSHKTFMPPFY